MYPAQHSLFFPGQYRARRDKQNTGDTRDKTPAGFSPKAAEQADREPVVLPPATYGFNEEAALLTSKLLFFVPLDAEL